jgi:hypothetical protein
MGFRQTTFTSWPIQTAANTPGISVHPTHLSLYGVDSCYRLKQQPPHPAITSRLRDPIASPHLPIDAPCLPAAPPPTPPPAASDEVLREGSDQKVIKDLLKEKADSLTQKAIASNTKKASLQGQSEAAYARARKAEIARAALDRPDEIIIEMIEEQVAAGPYGKGYPRPP